jgi:hypothetical protein
MSCIAELANASSPFHLFSVVDGKPEINEDDEDEDEDEDDDDDERELY